MARGDATAKKWENLSKVQGWEYKKI